MMGRLVGIGAEEILLSQGWNLVLTEPDACRSPADLAANGRFIPAPVPGTVAEALERVGLFDRNHPEPLNDRDAWYVCRLFDIDAGEAVLRFEGLATLCHVFLNGQEILASETMFAMHEVPVTLKGGDELALVFRALAPRLAAPGPRARWRTQMIVPHGLKNIRTSLLGYMPGWCPEIHPVGPFRPIVLARRGAVSFGDVAIRARLDEEGCGRLSLSLRPLDPAPDDLRLRCGPVEVPFETAGDGRLSAILSLPDARPWWPATHGDPFLYPLSLIAGEVELSLGQTGFRRIECDRGEDGEGFGLRVNGVPIFCRGAVWTSADIVRLPGGEADYEPFLRKAVAAGMNMIRIGGTMTYESEQFFRLCDRLGLLVWQDFMFANFDYPRNDPAFAAHVHAEIETVLAAAQGSPSLAVLCGGSEMKQQAAMLGLPEDMWASPIADEIAPATVARLRPDALYVDNSPSGGPLPFSTRHGVSHYYGVGAYMRPLDDLRRADLRFAAESLAFAHVPQPKSLERHLDVPPVHSPLWKARVPRDRGASWDFEDVRDFYLERLYDCDAARLRREDAARYLDFSRAVSVALVEEAFGEWRRIGSRCRGALVWTLMDLTMGPGWGVIDAEGEAKPVWYGLRRAFRPVQLILTDEGTDGLDLHLINESAEALDLEIELAALSGGARRAAGGSQAVHLPARGQVRLSATALLGGFFDITYAYRFGPPAHDVTVATLRHKDGGDSLAEAYHFPRGRAAALFDAGLTAERGQEGEAHYLDLMTERFAQAVHIEAKDFEAEEDWFHLPPGARKRVFLRRRRDADADAEPSGTVSALGRRSSVSF